MKTEIAPDFSLVNEKAFVDIPSSSPALKIPIRRVGMTNRPVNITVSDPFQEKSTNAVHLNGDVTVHASLKAAQRGLHMSRIEEALHELRFAGLAVKEYCENLAKIILDTQAQDESHIALNLNYERNIQKNVSGKVSSELIQIFCATENKGGQIATAIGVEVPFINACPCTQRWGMREYYGELIKLGYENKKAEELVKLAPKQAHTNRGSAKLSITDANVSFNDLYETLDGALPLVRELLKGMDEHDFVRRAHREGQFCEDNIRAIVAAVNERFTDRLPDSARVVINVEVDESVHFHNLCADVDCNFSEIKEMCSEA